MTESEQRYLEVLMEEMNGKFSLVLEGHDAIRREFNEQLTEVCQKQDMFESLLKFSHDDLSNKIDGVRTELKAEIQSVRTELKADIRAVDKGSEVRDAALAADIRAVDKGSEVRDAALAADIRAVDKGSEVRDAALSAGIRSVGEQVEGHEDRIRFLEKKAA